MRIFARFAVPALLAAAPLAVQAAPASSVSWGSITLTSQNVTLPFGRPTYAGADAAAINANCVACHSIGMVMTQPDMNAAGWKAEVAKMRALYKAPVAEQDVSAIVAYLVKIKGAK